MKNKNVSKSFMNVIRGVISGALLVGVGVLAYTPAASAHMDSMMVSAKTYCMCVTAPESRCFLVADMVHRHSFPFFQMMDKGFWHNGHYYHYYHRYYNYENGMYHTYYYYTW